MASTTKRFRNTSARWTLRRTIRWRISAWARRCSIRRITRRLPIRSARPWAATWIRTGSDVWSHIYIGKIYDLLGQRERAVNEYSLAQHTNDDTAGAQTKQAAIFEKAVQRRKQRRVSYAKCRRTNERPPAAACRRSIRQARPEEEQSRPDRFRCSAENVLQSGSKPVNRGDSIAFVAREPEMFRPFLRDKSAS